VALSAGRHQLSGIIGLLSGLPRIHCPLCVGFRKHLAAAVAAGTDLEKPLIAVRHECLACHQAFRVFAQTSRPPQPAAK
jgi:hypothetical protein